MIKNKDNTDGPAAEEHGDGWRWAMQKLIPTVRILVVPLAILLYAAILSYSLNESNRRALRLQHNSEAADSVSVRFKILSVNVARSELTARIQIGLAGKIAKDEVTPNVNLRFLVNAVTGQQHYDFPRGERVTPIEVVFPLSGESNLYPFDSYQSSIAFLVSKPGQVAKPQPPPPAAKAKPKSKSFLQRLTSSDEKETGAKPEAPERLVGKSELASHLPVPVSLDLSASIPGFKFEGEIAKKGSAEVTRIELKLRRADNVIGTSLGIQLMMVCLALSMLAMVLFGTIQGKESALAPLTISATLIFGLPALRATQPGVPPLGGFSDYVSYLWAEYIVAASTIIAIWTWIARHRSKNAPPVSDPAAGVEDPEKSAPPAQ